MEMSKEERARLERLFDPSLGRATLRDVEVTAAGAAYLLTRLDPRQRKPSPTVVQGFAKLMASGGYGECREPGIMIPREEPSVANGQHRLRGQVASGVTVRWTVHTGCTSEEIAAIDGLVVPRTTAQQVRFLGESVGRRIVSTMRAVRAIEEDTLSTWGFEPTHFGVTDYEGAMAKYGEAYGALREIEGFSQLAAPVAGVATFAARRHPGPVVDLIRACTQYLRDDLTAATARPHGDRDPGVKLGIFLKNNAAVGGGRKGAARYAHAAAIAAARKIQGKPMQRLDSGMWDRGPDELRALCS